MQSPPSASKGDFPWIVLWTSLSTAWAVYLATKPMFHFSYTPNGISGLLARQGYPKHQDYFFYVWYLFLSAVISLLFLLYFQWDRRRSDTAIHGSVSPFWGLLASFPLQAFTRSPLFGLAIPGAVFVLLHCLRIRTADSEKYRPTSDPECPKADHGASGAVFLGVAASLVLFVCLVPSIPAALLGWCLLLISAGVSVTGYLAHRFGRIAFATLAFAPLYFLPLLQIGGVGPLRSLYVSLALCSGLALAPRRMRESLHRPKILQGLCIGLTCALLFFLSFAMNFSPHGPFDLFHQGEALGPAQAYWNGKVPFKEVLPVHGLLEDGYADGLLMKAFGMDFKVFALRKGITDSLYLPCLYLLLCVLSQRLVLNLVLALWAPVVVSFANGRLVLSLLALALFTLWMKRPRPLFAAGAGLFASLSLFWSFDVGLYGLVTCGILFVAVSIPSVKERLGLKGVRIRKSAAAWAAGAGLAAIPIMGYLAARHALGEFFRFSFWTLPRSIDSMWSLPLADAVQKASQTAGLKGWIGLLKGDWGIHYILPAVLSLAAAYVIISWTGRLWTVRLTALLPSLCFCLLLYRSALGRSHFVFSALPIILAVLVCVETALQARHKLILLSAIGVFLVLFSNGLGQMRAYPERLRGFSDRVAGTGLVPLNLPMARGIRTSAEQKAELEWLWKARQSVAGAYPFWDFTNQPALYFFADAVNPTRFFQVPLASIPAYQEEVRRDIGERNVPHVLFSATSPTTVFDGVHNHERAPQLKAYFESHFPQHHFHEGLLVYSCMPEKGE
jgi:hypothetical protein